MRPFRRWRETALVGLLIGGFACGGSSSSQESAASTPTSPALAIPTIDVTQPVEPVANTPTPLAEKAAFADVTDSAGISFVHQELEGRMMPIGAGVVVLDFDGDGWDDLYFSNTNGPNTTSTAIRVKGRLRK